MTTNVAFEQNPHLTVRWEKKKVWGTVEAREPPKYYESGGDPQRLEACPLRRLEFQMGVYKTFHVSHVRRTYYPSRYRGPACPLNLAAG